MADVAMTASGYHDRAVTGHAVSAIPAPNAT
jgi:hypothetical protein